MIPDRVETRFQVVATPEEPLVLASGESLPHAALAYETYGRLNGDASNAVLVFHALSGSQHAAGFNSGVDGIGDRWTEECQTGWWNDFVGPGKALDTDIHYVVCANYLGGCYGSTGPASIDPITGRAYGGSFPAIKVSDIVDSQLRLLDALGIAKLHAAVGASLGGIMALNLATRFPERVTHVVPIATGYEVTPLQRLHNFEQVFAIETDPGFRAGDYDPDKPPDRGLAVARMIGHKTYVSLSAMEERARSECLTSADNLSWYQLSSTLESYMLHQAQKFTGRFDANTYLRIINAWQQFDLAKESGCESVLDAFARCCGQRFHIFSIDSDVCFYPEEQAQLAEQLKLAGVDCTRITVHSEKGHDSFLLEPVLFEPYIRAFLA
ncbi:MAG: homoserine O-acetyltransferase [Verrucomicrobiae bacterium]|nr:homoserine O-acetyltransferase [Verrucomicrobiae bacterium]